MYSGGGGEGSGHTSGPDCRCETGWGWGGWGGKVVCGKSLLVRLFWKVSQDGVCGQMGRDNHVRLGEVGDCRDWRCVVLLAMVKLF